MTKTKTYQLLKVTNVSGFILRLQFSDGVEKEIDFLPVFKKYARGANEKYLTPATFKKYKIDSGNLVWGEDWDMIFPLNELHSGKIR